MKGGERGKGVDEGLVWGNEEWFGGEGEEWEGSVVVVGWEGVEKGEGGG